MWGISQIFYGKVIYLVVATEIRCRSVISNEVETLLKPRFRPWSRRKNVKLTALVAMTNSLSRDGVRKQSRSKSCSPVQYDGTTVAPACGGARERQFIYARHHVHVLGVTMKQQVAGPSPLPLLFHPHPSYQTSMTDCATLMARVTLPFSPSPTGHFTVASASNAFTTSLF